MFRSFAESVDRVFLGGFVKRRHERRLEQREIREQVIQMRKALAALEETCGDRIIVSYDPSKTDTLAQLCDLHGSDKGSARDSGHVYPWPAHSYSDFYSRLFRHFRSSARRVFECGLGTKNPAFEANMGADGRPGASLRVWRDYFPNAMVIGADIDREVLFEEDRIKTFYVDQTDPAAIAALWRNVGMRDFDVMIDDGYHVFDAGTCLFENSISMLSQDGVYVIEDVTFPDLRRYAGYFGHLDYDVDFVALSRPRTSPWHNNLVVIRHRDRIPPTSKTPRQPEG